MFPLIMFAIHSLRVRRGVLPIIFVVLFLGTGVFFLSACYIPEAWAAVEETPVMPDISGGGWTGWFWRSDVFAWTAVPLTATVTQTADGLVSITTSKEDVGHYLEGNIDATGNLLLYDAYDGEDWSTHDGPVTDVYIKIEDYVELPTPEYPAPPMNIILLTREPKPKLPIAAISLLLGK